MLLFHFPHRVATSASWDRVFDTWNVDAKLLGGCDRIAGKTRGSILSVSGFSGATLLDRMPVYRFRLAIMRTGSFFSILPILAVRQTGSAAAQQAESGSEQ